MARPKKNPEATATEPKAKKETAAKTSAAKKETACTKTKKCAAKTETFKLELTDEQAQNATKVTVAGDFNAWNKDATPMTKTLTGFEVEITLEKGKSYQFRYVADDQIWFNDPYRKRVDNGMGEQNSVIEVDL